MRSLDLRLEAARSVVVKLERQRRADLQRKAKRKREVFLAAFSAADFDAFERLAPELRSRFAQAVSAKLREAAAPLAPPPPRQPPA